MTYLESVLTTESDKQKIQHLSGYSYAMFSRLFSVLADMTLSEYLCKRRLSEAVNDLKMSSDKVIDIAMKYGYDSADSFSAAFKNATVQCQLKFVRKFPTKYFQKFTYPIYL